MSIPTEKLTNKLHTASIEGSQPKKRLTEKEAIALLKGWDVKSTYGTSLNLKNGGTAFCYIIQVKDSPRGFIVNADNGKVYDSDEFYAKHGRQETYS